MNDWLASGLGKGTCKPITPNPSPPEGKLHLELCKPANTVANMYMPSIGQEGCGSGRIFTYDEPVALSSVVERVKALTGLKHGMKIAVRDFRFDEDTDFSISTVRLATAPSHGNSNSQAIKTVAICAGSGSDLLAPVKADLYFSGEMGHHDVLAALAQETSVILCMCTLIDMALYHG